MQELCPPCLPPAPLLPSPLHSTPAPGGLQLSQHPPPLQLLPTADEKGEELTSLDATGQSLQVGKRPSQTTAFQKAELKTLGLLTVPHPAAGMPVAREIWEQAVS